MKRLTRAHAAVLAMLAGLAAGPAGAYMQWGPAAALMVACVLLILIAVLLGWDR